MGALFETQLAPELVELKMKLFVVVDDSAPATSLVPSADEATPSQFAAGTLFEFQVIPKSVEVKTEPNIIGAVKTSALAATTLLPSADEATDHHGIFVGASLKIQEVPELVEM